MKNLKKLFDQSGKSGLVWYHEAHNFCKDVAKKNNISLAVVCGVVSALSPGTDWERNKKEAVALIEKQKISFTTYRRNVLKAMNILNGNLLPEQAFSNKTGAKTYNFFYNLLYPSNDYYVTIDRHAYRIATGKPYERLTSYQYGIVADYYRRQAAKLNITPSQLQATLWVDHRIKNNIKQIEVPF
jgi:hypothetical protein